MVDLSNCYLENVSLHRVGNQSNGDSLELSKAEVDLDDPELKVLLHKFFLGSFNVSEWYQFHFSNGDLSLNPVYKFAKEIFYEQSSFHLTSIHLAQHLFEKSMHPQIKAGDFFVARFSEIIFEGRAVQGIGLFKSEQKQSFIKTAEIKGGFTLNYDEGITPEKLDKGCLIVDLEEESGFKVLILDKSNRSGEARYWRDDFLMVQPKKDEYHFTKEFLTLTKDYVSTQLDKEFEVTKADQIDLLNRSVDFFKKKEKFVKEEFESEVLQDQGLITSFRTFDDAYRESKELDAFTEFEISSVAVKKQSKVFKSILKLDKNFHIYIHGDKSLIERGVDPDGRKFYKIYFTEESS